MRLNFGPRSIFCLMMNVELRPECVFGSRWVLWLISLWSFASGRVIFWLPCTKVVSAHLSTFLHLQPLAVTLYVLLSSCLKYFKLFSRMPANDSSLECCPGSGSSPVSRLSLQKLGSPGLSLLVSLSAFWLQCMLEDVVLMGCTSILKKRRVAPFYSNWVQPSPCWQLADAVPLSPESH